MYCGLVERKRLKTMLVWSMASWIGAIGVGRGAEVLWLDEMELWSTVHQSQHRSQRGWSSSIESFNLSKNLISRIVKMKTICN